jgi:hypothetical protein
MYDKLYVVCSRVEDPKTIPIFTFYIKLENQKGLN